MAIQKNAAFAEESAEVEVLLASLSKTKDLAKRIKSSLTQLDASGRVVKDAIGPIHNNTQQLHLVGRNIDGINAAIERLRQPLDAKGREETIIQQGPKAAGIQNYLGALKRIDRALSDLTSTNLRSNQQAISDFHTLLTTGVNQLQDLYRQSVSEDADLIEPLRYITKDITFPVYPQEKTDYLRSIAAAIVSASNQAARLGRRDDDPAVRIYTEIRAEYIAGSLQNLATASLNTSKRRGTDSEIYKQGTSGIGTYTNAIQGMLLAEFENVKRVFPRDVWERVYPQTTAKALTTFSRTLAELNSVVKSRVLTDCFLAYEIIEVVTPMSYHLESKTGFLRPQISDALRPIRDTARSSIYEIYSRTKSRAETVPVLPPDGNTIPLAAETAMTLRSLAQYPRPLSSLLASIGDKNWRKDPSALGQPSASSSTLNLDVTDPSHPFSGGATANLLPAYLTDILETFLTTLQSRAPALHRNNKPLQGVFQLNTLTVLLRTILKPTNNSSSSASSITSEDNSNLINNILTTPPNQNPTLESMKKTSVALYFVAWRETQQQLLDTIHTASTSSSHSKDSSRPLSGQPIDSTQIIKSLNSKDKENIRNKFRNFNTSFDECVARHKSLHMEPEVRAQLAREIQVTIEPLYGRFWDRYREVDKGKGKVVKYSKSELLAVLAGL